MSDTDRPDRETALKLLGWQGRDVTILEPVLLEAGDPGPAESLADRYEAAS